MKLQNLPKIPVEKLLKNLKLIYEKLPEKNRKNVVEELLEKMPTEVFLDVMARNGAEILNPLFNNTDTEFLAFKILDIFNKSISKSTKSKEKLDMIREKNEKYVARIFANNLKNDKKKYSIDDIKILLACNTNKNYLIKKVAEKNKNKMKKSMSKEAYIEFARWYKNILEIELNTRLEEIVKDIKDENTKWVVIKIIKDLLVKNNLSAKDIKKLKAGNYSEVYEIGDKVIKVGESREVYEVPNHSRILQPIIRREFPYFLERSKNKNVRSVCVEVQNKVDTNWYEGLTEKQIDEAIYKIYKELRADGIIWLDPKKENIGRLLKENTTHYYDRDGREIQPEDKSIGFYGKKGKRILQKGDLVILDTDFLVKKEDIKKSRNLQIFYFRDRFASRYDEEINGEKQYTK